MLNIISKGNISNGCFTSLDWLPEGVAFMKVGRVNPEEPSEVIKSIKVKLQIYLTWRILE